MKFDPLNEWNAAIGQTISPELFLKILQEWQLLPTEIDNDED